MPTAGGLVMNLPDAADNALLSFHGGGLDSETEEFEVAFRLHNPGAAGINKAAFNLDKPSNLTMPTFDASTGRFSGEFTLPGATAARRRKATYSGQIVWDGTRTQGYGFVLVPQLPLAPQTPGTAPRLSGKVTLTPNVN